MSALTLRITPLFFERVAGHLSRAPGSDTAALASQWAPSKPQSGTSPYIYVELDSSAAKALLELLPRIMADMDKGCPVNIRSGFTRQSRSVETTIQDFLDGKMDAMSFEQFEQAWKDAGFSTLVEVARALKTPYPTVRDYRRSQDGIPGSAQVAIELLAKQREYRQLAAEITALYPRCKDPQTSTPDDLLYMEDLIRKLARFS